ncbi:MAG: CehA/McbA family metallohydrolase [Clostridiales bacterium]|nr:CehA/McbA family metallohydrolase [Clostridiales bacterium]
MGRWYSGVVHSHTTRSDGKYSPQELVKKAEDKGLDFIIITDHNVCLDEIPQSENTLVIPGVELTDQMGHTNIWGVHYPIDNFDLENYEGWEKAVQTAKQNGATVCINHPLCSNCGWHWPLEVEKADCVEVWNGPQHTDNMICTSWWHDELRKGKKIPAVGGSDFHREHVVTAFLDNPTTYVYADECTEDEILKSIRLGHVTISPNVGGQMIEINSGSSIIGDTVKIKDDTTVTIKVNRIQKNQILRVIDRDGVKFEYKATVSAPYIVSLPVNNPGFIVAQVDKQLPPVYKSIFAKIENSFLNISRNEPLPDFIVSQTSAVYFE